MSEIVLTIEDAAARFADLVERVHEKRETAVLVKSGRPVARIVPVPAPGEVAEDLIAFLRRWRVEYPEPNEQLAADIDESRRAVQPPHDPWD